MVVYADLLVILNFIVDYFLLLATAKIIRKSPSVWRMLSGAAVGGAGSLFLFLPEQSFWIGAGFQIALCGGMVLCVFGFCGAKVFLRTAGVMILVTCGYAGLMTALWRLVKPHGMFMRNGVAYFSISPVVLLVASAVSYVVFLVVSAVFRRTSPLAERCTVTCTSEGRHMTFNGIVDTGNSLEDVFGAGEIIIVDRRCFEKSFGARDGFSEESLRARYRLIPCGTVAGGGVLEGYRCDRAVVSNDKQTVTLQKPVLAFSKTPLRDGYEAIVNPKVFL